MFYNGSSFNQDITNWNVCKVTNSRKFKNGSSVLSDANKPYFSNTSKCNGGNPKSYTQESYTQESYTQLYPNIEESFTILYPEEYNEEHKVKITFFK